MAQWRRGTFQAAAETIFPAPPIFASEGFPCLAILCQAYSNVPDFNRLPRLFIPSFKARSLA